jgi:16S rRNA (guanine1207-N2)-methyltransferase
MSHYYDEKQTTPLRKYPVSIRLLGHDFVLSGGSGVFSAKELDKGTSILIENCIIKEGWDVLDLGCGYGSIGITLAKAYKLGHLVMVDVNQRAVKLAMQNAESLGVAASAVRSDGFESVPWLFDTILLNPPQSAGKDVCFRLIEGALTHLKHDGLLQVVARHNKGGRSLSEKMGSVFGNVKDIAKQSGYRVYVSTNSSAP